MKVTIVKHSIFLVALVIVGLSACSSIQSEAEPDWPMLTPELWASMSVETLREVLSQGNDVNQLSDYDAPALQYAAGNAAPEVVAYLIERGADPTWIHEDGIGPLMIASIFNPDPEVIRVLVENGANIEAQDHDGGRALMYAAYGDFPQNVSMLIELGADVFAESHLGMTALFMAILSEHEEAIEILTAHKEYMISPAERY